MVLQGGFALLIFAFLLLTVVGQWDEIQQRGVHFRALWLLPPLVLVPVYLSLNAFGWDLLLRMLGQRIGAMQAQIAWGQPLLARYVPGSVLYLLARLLLSERFGVPRRVTLASIIYEQALSVAAAAAVSTWFFIDHPDLQGQPLRWAVLAIVPIALTLLHPRIFGPLVNRIFAAFGREPLPATISFGGVVGMLIFFAANWAIMGVAVYCIARSVTFLPLENLPIVGSAQAIGYVAAVASMVAPAGLGVRDAAFAWTVKSALPDRSFGVGSLIALVVRFVITVGELLYVAAVTLIAKRRGWSLRGLAVPIGGEDGDGSEGSERYAIDQLKAGEGEGGEEQGAVTGDGHQGQDPDQVPGQ
jgi:hypothetical protein